MIQGNEHIVLLSSRDKGKHGMTLKFPFTDDLSLYTAGNVDFERKQSVLRGVYYQREVRSDGRPLRQRVRLNDRDRYRHAFLVVFK